MKMYLAFLFGLVAVSPAGAISDDANPWLALEHAACVAHRGADYSKDLGVSAYIAAAEWRGGTLDRPALCYLAGVFDTRPFVIGIPTARGGRIFSTRCDGTLAPLFALLDDTGKPLACVPW